MSPARVVAVVVAYNRRDLLGQTLDALAAQERSADAVVVIDNASTDDSAALAESHPVGATVITLPHNTGGSGGFTAGTAHAVAREVADLVWLMDDDTIPSPTALGALLEARGAYNGRVAALASRAVWHDGREHPMNTPRPRPFASARQWAKARAVHAVPVRTASFVSLLLDVGAVRHEGLPEADYFIWNDDFEYSARLLRHRVGLYVPASVVEHRTKKFGASDADPGDRFFYEMRNKLWMFRWSRAFGTVEGLLYAGSSVRRWLRTYARSSDRALLREAGRRGASQALAGPPRPAAVVLDDMGTISEDVAALVARAAARHRPRPGEAVSRTLVSGGER